MDQAKLRDRQEIFDDGFSKWSALSILSIVEHCSLLRTALGIIEKYWLHI